MFVLSFLFDLHLLKEDIIGASGTVALRGCVRVDHVDAGQVDDLEGDLVVGGRWQQIEDEQCLSSDCVHLYFRLFFIVLNNIMNVNFCYPLYIAHISWLSFIISMGSQN